MTMINVKTAVLALALAAALVLAVMPSPSKAEGHIVTADRWSPNEEQALAITLCTGTGAAVAGIAGLAINPATMPAAVFIILACVVAIEGEVAQ